MPRANSAACQAVSRKIRKGSTSATATPPKKLQIWFCFRPTFPRNCNRLAEIWLNICFCPSQMSFYQTNEGEDAIEDAHMDRMRMFMLHEG